MINLEVYLLFCTMVFLLMGGMLFVYIWLMGLVGMKMVWLNDPVFYFCLGITCMVCWFVQHRYSFFDEDLKNVE